ncbi:hypothetical protein [Aeromicrobium sp.]|uniref:hypothetical protein n=1 Tax=Aeromicrobium sp. TaxID=1871063 RepID=UPI002FC7B382
MSDSNGPINRRRIAGEGNPAAKKTPAKKAPAKKAAVKAAPVKKVATPAKKVAPPVPPLASGASIISKSREPKVEAVRGDGGGPSRRDLKWLIPSIAAAVAALIVGVLLAVDGVQDIRNNDGDRASTERAASAAASAAAETIFSYQYDKLDEHLADSKKLMTSKFAKDFEKIAPALDDIAPQRRVQVEAVGRNAAALSCGDECSPGTVNVLVFLDQARLIDGSKEPDVIGNRITLKMVHRDGVWLVDDIRAV